MANVWYQKSIAGLRAFFSNSLYGKFGVFIVSTVVLTGLWIALFLFMYWIKTYPAPVLPSEDMLKTVEFKPYVNIPEDLMVLTERPVFWPERSPPQDELVAVATEAASPERANRNVDDFVVMGIISAGAASTVSIEYKSKPYQLKVGESLVGWTFQEATADQVVFVEARTLGEENVNLHTLKIYPEVHLPAYWPRDKAIWSGNDQNE